MYKSMREREIEREKNNRKSSFQYQNKRKENAVHLSNTHTHIHTYINASTLLSMPYLHISTFLHQHLITFVVCTSFWIGSHIFKLLYVVSTRSTRCITLFVSFHWPSAHQHHLSPLVIFPMENLYSIILNNVLNKILFASSLYAAESDQALKSQNTATKLYNVCRMCCNVCHVHDAIIEHSAIEYIVATTTMKTTATSAIGRQQHQQQQQQYQRLLVNNLILSFSMPY